MDDVAKRLATRVQITTDGHKTYLVAVEGAFGMDVDYAQPVKIYGDAPGNAKGRYSPAHCTGIEKVPVMGSPDPAHVSTSYIERQNLTMRMHMRRFTRLTNAFSKKVENHAYAAALHMMYYNFVKVHSKLRMSPAMASGVSDKLWEIEDVAALVEAADAPAKVTEVYKVIYKMKSTLINQVSRRFSFNVRRIIHLQALYEVVLKRKELDTEYKTDLLRSGVVLMHASLEDMLRQLLKSRSISNPDLFGEKLRIVGPGDGSKPVGSLNVKDLYALKGAAIDDIIASSIDYHLQRRSFNDKSEINLALVLLSLEPADYAAWSNDLNDMISRRHKIVHESDRKEQSSKSHGRPQPLDLATFEIWLGAVSQFGQLALSQMGATDFPSNSN